MSGNIDGISERPVAECTAAQVADALTRSFEGYVVPVDVSARGYEQRFRPENVDPFSSYVYVREKRPVAIILIARRGWISRVAAMAVVPEERGRGFGKSLVHRISRLPCTTGLGFRSHDALGRQVLRRAFEKPGVMQDL